MHRWRFWQSPDEEEGPIGIERIELIAEDLKELHVLAVVAEFGSPKQLAERSAIMMRRCANWSNKCGLVGLIFEEIRDALSSLSAELREWHGVIDEFKVLAGDIVDQIVLDEKGHILSPVRPDYIEESTWEELVHSVR